MAGGKRERETESSTPQDYFQSSCSESGSFIKAATKFKGKKNKTNKINQRIQGKLSANTLILSGCSSLWNQALSEGITELCCSCALWFVLDSVLPATMSQISLEQMLLGQKFLYNQSYRQKVTTKFQYGESIIYLKFIVLDLNWSKLLSSELQQEGKAAPRYAPPPSGVLWESPGSLRKTPISFRLISVDYYAIQRGQ